MQKIKSYLKALIPSVRKPAVIYSHNDKNPELVFSRKIYMCIQLLGGQSDLLSTVGSWRRDVSDEETFHLLDLWISETIKERQISLNQIKKWHNK